MFTNRKASLLTLTLSSMAFLFALSLVVTWAASSGAEQGKQRVLVLDIYRDQPVEITAIKVGEVSIQPKRKFAAGRDWLNDLTFTLKNVYNRPVAQVTLLIGAYYEKSDGKRARRGGQDVLAGVELKYGFQPPRPGEPDPPYYVPPILPGQTVDLAFSERTRDELYSMLTNGKASTDVTELNVRVYSVFFEGDSETKWRGGMMRRDPNKPDSFVMVSSVIPSSRATKKPRSERASHMYRRRAPSPPEDTVIDACTLKEEGESPRNCDALIGAVFG